MKTKLISLILIAAGCFSFTLSNLTSSSTEKEVFEKKDKGITFFEGNWEEALEKAKEEDKLIFLDAYASWCGPCKLMAKNTFTDQKIGDYFNAHFINFKMDMEKDPQGPRLSKKLALSAYPSLFFIDKNESVVHSGIGYLQAEQLMELGQQAENK
ncbi:MAG: DUF255 domain-containing protein [Crocinitomicaceae bacterium]